MLIKRAVDIIVAGIGLMTISPLLLVLAVAIAASSEGGVLFRQERVGFEGKVFWIYKFRSMVSNAEAVGPFFTSDGDPRITPIGRFIRRTSLDELPQLFNVLIGDMSLVGPRPDVPAQRGLYTDEEWRIRNSVRPGITGLAQATLRSAATGEQRKALDLEYAQRVSILLDLKILMLTVRQVLFRGGN